MKVFKSKIIENKEISPQIYRLIAENEEEIFPGQFYMLKTLNNEFLLPRPISVNDTEEGKVTFLYRTAGTGTKVISCLEKGDELQLFGPLGNGFDLKEITGRTAVIGGGIGIAPLLYLTKKLGKNADVFLGYKDSVYIKEEFEKHANNVIASTEDGSKYNKGFITDFIDYSVYETVVTCGPEIMMHKIAEECRKQNIKCFVSLEKRMACGLGACLGCVVKTVEGNKRVCKDGPVFNINMLAEEV